MRWLRKLTYRLERRSVHFLILLLLGLSTVFLIALAAFVYSLITGQPFDSAAWWSFVRISDPGYLQEDGQGGFWIGTVSTVITLFGFAVFASLVIGVVSDKVADVVRGVRSGRRAVVFSDHVVILGWSQKVFAIVTELHIANPDIEIAILASMSKEEADDALETHVFIPLSRTRRPDGRLYEVKRSNVVFRPGNPANAVDLELVGVGRARSVIVIGSDVAASVHDRDVRTVKALLAAKNACSPGTTMVGEVFDRANRRLAQIAGGEDAVVFCSADVVSRIIVQSSLQPGLASVIEDLLSFEGSEVHLKQVPRGVVRKGVAYTWPQLVDEVVVSTADHVPMGVYRDGVSTLLPESWTFSPGDELIVLSADDSPLTISADKKPAPVGQLTGFDPPGPPSAVRVLVLGHNPEVDALVSQFSDYIVQYDGMQLHLHLVSPKMSLERRSQLEQRTGNGLWVTTSGDVFTRVEVAERILAERDYDVLIILSEAHSDFDEADAEVLMTLLTVRDLQQSAGAADVSITTELVDPEHRDLVARQHVQDIIISHRMFSMLVAQVSQDSRLAPVLDDFFGYTGAEMYLRPCGVYVRPDEEVPFEEIVRRSARRGEVALGLRLCPPDGECTILLNPPHREPVALGPEDQVIVFANE
jgi:hypothetical protein